MKVVDLKVHLLSAPIDPRYAWKSSLGYSVKRDTVVVEVQTDEGITGYGESNHALSPTVIAEIIQETLKPLVIGEDPFYVEKIWAKMYKGCRMLGNTGAPVMAMSGVEIALWDVVGKALKTPIYKLLGGYRDRIKAYAGGLGLGWKDPDQLAQEAKVLVQQGFKALKLRVGRNPKQDLECVSAVRDAVGRDIDIMVDVNGGYSRRVALDMARAYQDLGLLWIEEPLPYTDIEGLAELAANVDVSIAGGENVYTIYGFDQALRSRALDIVQPDCCKCGGILQAKKIASMAEAANLPCAPHIFGTAIGTAISLQLLGSIPNGLICEFDVLPDNPLMYELAPGQLNIQDGFVEIPQKPGIGIELNVDAFKKFPFIPGPAYVL
ncbi:MAG TPA: mandelate racemase/muconate lactonizing enzyme family protein [Firmicutes bacterium]|nr:mandelate racemase/muconate lactonizing enzyme family protein [Bacillota bacterium]